MPGMNGLETIRRARQRLPGLKPLLITGYASAVSGNAAGKSLLRKPFAPAELARRSGRDPGDVDPGHRRYRR